MDDEGGFSTLQLVLIFGAAIGVIAGIGWPHPRVMLATPRPAAARAARAADPGSGDALGPAQGNSKSAREREREKARQRKKAAKAARDQRQAQPLAVSAHGPALNRSPAALAR